MIICPLILLHTVIAAPGRMDWHVSSGRVLSTGQLLPLFRFQVWTSVNLLVPLIFWTDMTFATIRYMPIQQFHKVAMWQFHTVTYSPHRMDVQCHTHPIVWIYSFIHAHHRMDVQCHTHTRYATPYGIHPGRESVCPYSFVLRLWPECALV